MNKGIKITLWVFGSAAVIVGGYFAYKAMTKKADVAGGDGSLSDAGNLGESLPPSINTEGKSAQQLMAELKANQGKVSLDMSKLNATQVQQMQAMGIPVRGGAVMLNAPTSTKILAGRG